MLFKSDFYSEVDKTNWTFAVPRNDLVFEKYLFIYIIFSFISTGFFLKLLFVKGSNNIFTVIINNNICPWHSAFDFFNYKIFFRIIWKTTFFKNVFIFWYPNGSKILNLGPSLLFSLLKTIYVFDFRSTDFILIVLWYVVYHLFNYSQFIKTHVFGIEVIYSRIFLFKALINISATTNLLGCVLNKFLYH